MKLICESRFGLYALLLTVLSVSSSPISAFGELATKSESDLTQPSSRSQEHTSCSADEIQPFPLPMLRKDEREARLHFFIGGTPLHILDSDAGTDITTCTSILRRLKSFEDVTVLEPTFYAEKPDEAVELQRMCQGSFGTTRTIEAKIAPACPTLDLESEYKTYFDDTAPAWTWGSAYTRNPSFLRMSRSDKEASSVEFLRATANFEYYDLSHYLGKGMWGYFAEGALRYSKCDLSHDLSTDDCLIVKEASPASRFRLQQGSRCNPRFTSVSKIFNSQKCEVIADPYEPVTRLRISGADQSFFAFISISDKLYRLTFRSPVLFYQFADVAIPKRRLFDIFIDAIRAKDDGLTFENICTFSTRANSKRAQRF